MGDSSPFWCPDKIDGSLTLPQDPLFSEPLTQQLIGRLWRYPQRLQVIIYKLLAVDMADPVLESMAHAKSTIAEVLTTTKTPMLTGKILLDEPE